MNLCRQTSKDKGCVQVKKRKEKEKEKREEGFRRAAVRHDNMNDIRLNKLPKTDILIRKLQLNNHHLLMVLNKPVIRTRTRRIVGKGGTSAA